MKKTLCVFGDRRVCAESEELAGLINVRRKSQSKGPSEAEWTIRVGGGEKWNNEMEEWIVNEVESSRGGATDSVEK